MFGFLRLKSCSLTAQDKLLYRSHFCSACHAMTKFGGRLSSLLTNYDITFWLLLQSALDSKPIRATQLKPCTALPFHRVPIKPLNDDVGQTMAALNLALVGAKIADDHQDGAKFKATAGKALYGRKVEKAENYLRDCGYQLDAVFGLHQAQSAAEKDPSPTLQSLAQPTADALGNVFATIAKLQDNPQLTTHLRDFGCSLGAFLYLWDALADLEADRKQGAFNAIDRVFGDSPFRQDLAQALGDRLFEMESGLKSLALGPESQLCFALLHSLQKQVREKFPEPALQASLSTRQRLAKAGFVRTQDCDCCEVGCCECGSCCDINLCDCNPCDGGSDTCCEFNCCDLSDCCCRSGHSDNCCGTGSTCTPCGCCDIFCLESLCCHATNPHSVSHDRHAPQPGIVERFRQAKQSRNLTSVDNGPSDRQCPRCELNMVQLTVGDITLDECRNCGGIWCDDKEIDGLARMIRLPHNLFNRYPVEEHSSTKLPGERDCPSCKQRLTVVPYLGVPLEMCQKCHGFWLDYGVLKRVLQAKRSPARLLKSHKQEWRCPYCEGIAAGGSDVCRNCGAPRPKSGFTGKLI